MCHMLCPDDRAITLFALGLPLASTRRTSPSRRPRYEANMMVVSWPRYAYHMSSIFLHTHSALKLNRVSAISKATCRSAQGTCITFHPRKSSFAPVVPVFVCLSRTFVQYPFARMRRRSLLSPHSCLRVDNPGVDDLPAKQVPSPLIFIPHHPTYSFVCLSIILSNGNRASHCSCLEDAQHTLFSP